MRSASRERDETVRVLAIDQDRSCLEQLAALCRRHGVAFVGSRDLTDGLRWLNLSPVDVIFCDVAFLRESHGSRLAMGAHEGDPLLVATVGANNLETEASVRQLGVFYYLLKPFDGEEIQSLLASAENALT